MHVYLSTCIVDACFHFGRKLTQLKIIIYCDISMNVIPPPCEHSSYNTDISDILKEMQAGGLYGPSTARSDPENAHRNLK
jgi:hypothetical protein